MSGKKKTEHISFRVDEDFGEMLESWAEQEELSVADLARKLTRVAARLYGEAGSLHELKKKFGEGPPLGKVRRGSAS